MKIERHTLDSDIAYLALGQADNGPIVVFTHANGYPPLSYRSLLTPLASQNRLVATTLRPLWDSPPDPQALRSWHVFADDLIRLIETLSEPVIHIGHSMGAISGLLAAHKRPDLFARLVAIDPVLIEPAGLLLLNLFARFAPTKMPLVMKTLKRTDHWPDREAAYQQLRSRRVFSDISDAVMRDHIEAAIRLAEDGGVTLTYSKEWEAMCYRRITGAWQAAKNCKVPSLTIRGGKSDTLSGNAWRRLQKLAPRNAYIEVEEAGHLLPLEAPDQLAVIIQKWLAD